MRSAAYAAPNSANPTLNRWRVATAKLHDVPQSPERRHSTHAFTTINAVFMMSRSQNSTTPNTATP